MVVVAEETTAVAMDEGVAQPVAVAAKVVGAKAAATLAAARAHPTPVSPDKTLAVNHGNPRRRVFVTTHNRP